MVTTDSISGACSMRAPSTCCRPMPHAAPGSRALSPPGISPPLSRFPSRRTPRHLSTRIPPALCREPSTSNTSSTITGLSRCFSMALSCRAKAVCSRTPPVRASASSAKPPIWRNSRSMETLLHESEIAWAHPRSADYNEDDARKLEGALRRSIEGEVRFDTGSRALYATDGSNYRQVPIGVVLPKTVEDVLAAMELCRRHDAPVLARGGGTSLAGQCCNVAVVFDFTKYLNKLIDIDPQAKTARVQPGIVLDWLRAAAERHQLTFGPDPATHNHNTLGGMIGNNSCGTHSVMAGKTEENVIELDILTYDGLRMRVGETPPEEL